MNEHVEAAVKAVHKKFTAEQQEYQGEVTLIVRPQELVKVALLLRDSFVFDMLVDETAVDYWPQETPRFHIVYQLYATAKNALLRLRVPLNGHDPFVDSLVPVWPVANWHEREIWDMFGVHFNGHPDPRRILMPSDWQGHPLRKDYPLGYEEVQFTFNYDEIKLRKPYANIKPGRKSNV